MKSSLLIFSLFLLPAVAFAGGDPDGLFRPIVGIPGLQDARTFDQYIDALYALAISLAALIAVVKIVIAGAKYMMDDIVTRKSEAKEDIKNALIGLLIIIGAVIILNTINSDLTNLHISATPAVIDNSVDEMTLSDAFRSGYCDAGNGCTNYRCTSTMITSVSTDPDMSCERRCNAINGIYEERTRTINAGGGTGTINESVCGVSQSALGQTLVDQHCPAGETCYAAECDNNGVGYGADYGVFEGGCEGACTESTSGYGFNGAFYERESQMCVLVGRTDQDTTIQCQRSINERYGASACAEEENACTAENDAGNWGYVSGRAADGTSFTCRYPNRSTTPTPSAPRTAPGIRVETNQSYVVQDPAYVDPQGVSQPAGPDHAAIITFPDTLIRQGEQVQVIINGQTRMIGCDNIFPSVCI